MILGFVGAGGGIILLVVGQFLAVFSLFFLASGIFYSFKKRPKPAVFGFILALVFGFFPYKAVSYLYACAEAEKTRKRNFHVTATLSPSGEYLVSVDGLMNPDELILLQDEVTFQISFPHAKPLEGRCGHFYSRRMDGGFGSLILSRIDIKDPDRSAYFADFIPRSPGAKYAFETETYRIYFRRDVLNITCLKTKSIGER